MKNLKLNATTGNSTKKILENLLQVIEEKDTEKNKNKNKKVQLKNAIWVWTTHNNICSY